MRKLIMIAPAALLLGTPALAQHKHGDTKGPKGARYRMSLACTRSSSPVAQPSLSTSSTRATSRSLPKGYTGSVLIVSGSDRETVQLTAADNSLKGEAKKAVAAGASLTLQLKTGAGKSGQARFKK